MGYCLLRILASYLLVIVGSTCEVYLTKYEAREISRSMQIMIHSRTLMVTTRRCWVRAFRSFMLSDDRLILVLQNQVLFYTTNSLEMTSYTLRQGALRRCRTRP